MKVNSDNTIKLITEESIAGIPFDDTSSDFKGSNVQNWLNK